MKIKQIVGLKGKLCPLSIGVFLLSCASKVATSPIVANHPATKTVAANIKADTLGPLSQDDWFFVDLFKKHPGKLDQTIINRQQNNIQVVFTEITQNADGRPSFNTKYFNKSGLAPFYPGTAVKLFLAQASLEKLNTINKPNVSKYTTVLAEKSHTGQTAAYNDPHAVDGKPTIANYIKRSLIANDELALNKLYEFIGQEGIANFLKKNGFNNTNITGRVGEQLTHEQNKRTNEFKFVDNNGNLLYKQPAAYNTKSAPKPKALLMNFPADNTTTLHDLHKCLMEVVFKIDEKKGLFDADADFLKKYLGQLPSESTFPDYDAKSYPDDFAKYFKFNSDKQVRYFNVSGEGYGYVTDVSLVVDFNKKVQYIIGATYFINKDLNWKNATAEDYEPAYEFFRNLSEAVHQYSISQKPKIAPNLDNFNIRYDK